MENFTCSGFPRKIPWFMKINRDRYSAGEISSTPDIASRQGPGWAVRPLAVLSPAAGYFVRLRQFPPSTLGRDDIFRNALRRLSLVHFPKEGCRFTRCTPASNDLSSVSIMVTVMPKLRHSVTFISVPWTTVERHLRHYCYAASYRVHALRKMWPIATDVAYSVVCLSVCACWLHGCSLQNGWTDQDAVWEMG